MRKKFTLLFAALLACVGVAKAEVTDFPQMSTGDDIKWYTIKNVRQGKFATYSGDNATMTQQTNASAASFFYFTASTTEGAVKIHNYAAGEKLCASHNSWTATGIDWYLAAQATGVSICTSTGEWNAWNDASGGGQTIAYWSASDPGSAWEISLVTDFSAVINVPAAKDAAIAEINNYATVSTLYPAATDAVDAVDAVNPASNGLKDLNDAVEAINAIVVNYRNSAYQALDGKYFTIKTLATDRSQGFMKMDATKVIGTADASSPANIWQFVCNDNGTVNIYNPYTGKYLCEPQGNSEDVAVTTDKANAGAYVLNVNASPSVADAKVKFTSNTKSVHMASGHTLVRWDNGAASEWQVVEVTNFSALINSYKTASTATLDSWATLSVVFDAALIGAAKAAINGIATTNWATFAAIDAELKKVTEKVAEKYFTFKNDDNVTSARIDAYLAANANTNKGYGTKTFDYSAIWRLLSAGGTSFYLYNELNNVYLKNPSSGDLVADAAQAATYTFEIVDAATNKAELKSGNETLHLANDCSLMSYDSNDPASRWYIATYDYKADLTALITENENNHEEVPSLGKYPTAAYEALVEAGNSATTVVAVAEAIAEFKAAINAPVYIISGVHDYANNKAIYYHENNPVWRWDTKNVTNKAMWMMIPGLTTPEFALDTEYQVVDVRNGLNLCGHSYIKFQAIENWAGVYNLQYGKGDRDYIHAGNHSNNIVTNWNAATTSANQASAWQVEYIGNTYDLNQLTDENEFTITEGENYTYAIQHPVKELNYNRTFSNCNWQSLYVPFDIPVSELTESFDVARIESVEGGKGLSNVVMNIEKITEGELTANTAYFIRAKEQGSLNLELKLTTIIYPADESSVEYNVGDFKIVVTGTYEKMSLGEGQYALSGGKWMAPASADVKLNPFRVFCTVTKDGEPLTPEAAAAMAIRISTRGESDEETTNIESISKNQDADVIYDLLGRRVLNTSKGGIYIINNKKVVIK